MYELFSTLDSEQTFNVIDTIVVDTIIEDHKVDGNLTEIRVKINKFHDKMGGVISDSGRDPEKMRPPEYIEPTENGYPGLLPPVG